MFVGEETGRTGAAGGYVWVVDPQDGTADFLAGLRISAVSLALLRDGWPVLRVVHAPLASDEGGDLIAWDEEAALSRNHAVVARPGRDSPAVNAMNAAAPDHARHNHQTLQGMRILAVPSPAYRLALAAVGEVDAGISLVAGLDYWDVAGGQGHPVVVARLNLTPATPPHAPCSPCEAAWRRIEPSLLPG